MLEKRPELRGVIDVRARRDEVATGEALVEGRVLPAVELVDGELPDWLTPGGAIVCVAMALVGHPESVKVRKRLLKNWRDCHDSQKPFKRNAWVRCMQCHGLDMTMDASKIPIE